MLCIDFLRQYFFRQVLSVVHRTPWNFVFRTVVLFPRIRCASACVPQGGGLGGGQDASMRVVLRTHVYLKGIALASQSLRAKKEKSTACCGAMCTSGGFGLLVKM